MTISLDHMDSDEQIAATYEVMQQRRPHIVRDQYVPAIRALMLGEGLRLLALLDAGTVRAVAVDDLVCDELCGRAATARN